MLINIPGIQSFKLPAEPDLALIAPKKHTFEIGKVLSALVIGRSGDNTLALNINNQQVNVKTSHAFMPGEELKLKVAEGDKQVVLQVQKHQLSTTLLHQALRKVLPNQAPVTPVLNAVKEVSSALTSTLHALPQPVRQQIQVINSIIPSLTQITQSQGLKQAIQNSGVFLESKLLSLEKLPVTKAPNIQALPPTIIKDIKHQLLTFLKNINTQLAQMDKATPPPSQPLATKAPADNKTLAAPVTPRFTSDSMPASTAGQSNQGTAPLSLSAQLQRAAQLIRSTAQQVLAPSDKPATDASKAAKANLPQPPASSTTSASPLSAYQSHTDKSLASQFMKHASLPIQGATPQPIKNEASLAPPHQHPKQLLEGLKEGVSSALSRIQANQLATLIKDPSQLPTFLLDIPVNIDEKQTEVLPFLIKQELQNTDEDDAEQKKHWSMMLALDKDNLGPLQVKVSLNHDKINVSIWSDDPSTKALFEANDEDLKSMLMAEQLLIGHVIYHQGLKENNIDNSTINLLDVKI